MTHASPKKFVLTTAFGVLAAIELGLILATVSFYS